MNKLRISTLTALLCTASVFLTACANNKDSETFQESATTQVSINGEILTLLDGTKAVEGEIVKFEKAGRFNQSEEDNFIVNICFCVPFKTPAEKRTAFEKGDWVKLKAGEEINGFAVEKAESSYFQPLNSEDYLFLPPKLVQKVTLKGKFSCVGKAHKSLALDGSETGEIVIVPDDDALKNFFSLKPSLKTTDGYQEFDDADDYFENKETLYFYITDKTDGFEQIIDKLNSEESAKVKLEADGFEISYTFETGNFYDGSNVGTVNGGVVSLAD